MLLCLVCVRVHVHRARTHTGAPIPSPPRPLRRSPPTRARYLDKALARCEAMPLLRHHLFGLHNAIESLCTTRLVDRTFPTYLLEREGLIAPLYGSTSKYTTSRRIEQYSLWLLFWISTNFSLDATASGMVIKRRISKTGDKINVWRFQVSTGEKQPETRCASEKELYDKIRKSARGGNVALSRVPEAQSGNAGRQRHLLNLFSWAPALATILLCIRPRLSGAAWYRYTYCGSYLFLHIENSCARIIIFSSLVERSELCHVAMIRTMERHVFRRAIKGWRKVIICSVAMSGRWVNATALHGAGQCITYQTLTSLHWKLYSRIEIICTYLGFLGFFDLKCLEDWNSLTC